MPPLRLWIAYCSILQVPPRLHMAWWAALWRSRRPEAQALCAQCQRLSTQRVVDGNFLQQQAGPAPMVRLLEQCVDARLISRTKAKAILASMLDFTMVETTEDWRGVALSWPRWFTEAEATEKRHEAVHAG